MQKTITYCHVFQGSNGFLGRLILLENNKISVLWKGHWLLDKKDALEEAREEAKRQGIVAEDAPPGLIIKR